MIPIKRKWFNMLYSNSCLQLVTTLNFDLMKTSLFHARSCYFLRFSIVILLVFLFSSCEKVINLDLNEAEKKYVIEASITDQPGTASVLLSQTKNFDDNNDLIGVSGALVAIQEEGGSITALTETTPGHYEAPALVGNSGKTY